MNITRFKLAILLCLSLILSGSSFVFSERADGPLRAHPDNPRYFTDGSGKAVYLTGSHVWNNLVDMGPGDPPPSFDFEGYLDRLEKWNHNFIRLWAWELTTWDTTPNSKDIRKDEIHVVAPHPWMRSGSGKALDGKSKFDLNKFNEAYFQRLRKRVAASGERGIYVSVMLFEGWGLQRIADGWKSHPFNRDNNVNRIDGDRNGDGRGVEIHTLGDPEILTLQKKYIRKVVESLNDLDNVLFEITNENHSGSTKWQYHTIDFIHELEKGLPKRHPVGMTFQFKGGANKILFESPADWISPNNEGGYRDNPPDTKGRKVILSDTDHLWGIGGNHVWAWKSFLRGLNPIFMDPYDGVVLGKGFDPKYELLRKNMGYTLRYARKMDLAKTTPRSALTSTKYCLARPGREYLVYAPKGGKFTVDLSGTAGTLSVEWFNPRKGVSQKGAKIKGGGQRTFTPPFEGDAVLYLKNL